MDLPKMYVSVEMFGGTIEKIRAYESGNEIVQAFQDFLDEFYQGSVEKYDSLEDPEHEFIMECVEVE